MSRKIRNLVAEVVTVGLALYADTMTTYAPSKKQLLNNYITEIGGLDTVVGQANINITIHEKAFHLFREITSEFFCAIDIRFPLGEVCDEFRNAIIQANKNELREMSNKTTVDALVYSNDGRIRVLVIPQFGIGNSLAVTADYGCVHKMERTNLGRCYNRYTCEKCGYSYEVDSGD
jgi:hypothetical protein